MEHSQQDDGRSALAKQILCDRIAQRYADGEALYPMKTSMATLQEYIDGKRQAPSSCFKGRDIFGNEVDMKIDPSQIANSHELIRGSRCYVCLFPLQHLMWLVNREGIFCNTCCYYPASLELPPVPTERESSKFIQHTGKISQKFKELETNWTKDGHSGNRLESEIFKALAGVSQDIDKIVCFDLGFEDALESDREDKKMDFRGMKWHLLAFHIKDHIKDLQKSAISIIFQDPSYTDATTDILKAHCAEATTSNNNTAAYHDITANTLVIWMGGVGGTSVKQIIADFQLKENNMPLPRAMIWLEEGENLTTLDDIRRLVSESRVMPSTHMGSPRTYTLHQRYNKHELPSPPKDDPFHSIPKLTVYTRKE
ncbi:hypothetical protein HD806DRAFT_527108 [Xylariaceae sp. AK1471]|nr:hypothetical protein HD806DRAFT_527108 [Xylariaceae sp. AK1471]